MVLAFISREAVDDYFRAADLTPQRRNLLISGNRTKIEPVIAGKYDRGETTTFVGAGGQQFPRIDLSLADLEQATEKLTDSVLDIAAGTAFQPPRDQNNPRARATVTARGVRFGAPDDHPPVVTTTSVAGSGPPGVLPPAVATASVAGSGPPGVLAPAVATASVAGFGPSAPEKKPPDFALDTPDAGLDRGFLSGPPRTSLTPPVAGAASVIEPHFGFAESGDAAGFGQAPFGDRLFTDTAPPFALDTQGQGVDEGARNAAPATSAPRLFVAEEAEPPLYGVAARYDLAFPQKNHASLAQLAISLEKLAREEIDRIDSERPNEPTIIEENNRRRELLTILADGFAKIAAALNDVAESSDQPVLLGKAKEIVDTVNDQITWVVAKQSR